MSGRLPLSFKWLLICCWMPASIPAWGTDPSFAESIAAQLHRAVRLDDLTTVQRLASQHEALLDSPGENGITPLAEAVRWGHQAVYTSLIRAGADPDRADADGRTALHHAAEAGEPVALRQLIEAAAQLDARDNFQYTALHIVARRGDLEGARLLVTAGADINARIDIGYTAADLAAAYPEVLAFLRGNGGVFEWELE